MDWYRWDEEDLVVELKVQPRAARDELVQAAAQERPRLRLRAPPVDDRANRRAREWLAEAFGVAFSRVLLEQGLRARTKRFRIIRPARLPAALGIAPR